MMDCVIKASAFNILKCAHFHTSSSCNAKPGHFMKKIMGYSSKKRRAFSEPAVLPTAELFSNGSYDGRRSGSARRASVLNKLFMTYITDLMATGESSLEFLGHQIEINRVQIATDFRSLNVFWVGKGTECDDVTEKALKKNAGFLRHELSTLKVMGNVPIINFVKDKQYSQIMEVDVRLSKADYGEDYVPMALSTKLKAQLELLTTLPPSIKEKIQDLEKEMVESSNGDEEDLLPPMPQDVLGLDHSLISERIRKSLRGSQAIHRRVSSTKLSLVETVNENPIEFATNKERRAAFQEFLKKRELLQRKMKKMDKNYLPDKEYIREEFERQQQEYFHNMGIYEEEEDDIIEEGDEAS